MKVSGYSLRTLSYVVCDVVSTVTLVHNPLPTDWQRLWWLLQLLMPVPVALSPPVQPPPRSVRPQTCFRRLRLRPGENCNVLMFNNVCWAEIVLSCFVSILLSRLIFLRPFCHGALKLDICWNVFFLNMHTLYIEKKSWHEIHNAPDVNHTAQYYTTDKNRL